MKRLCFYWFVLLGIYYCLGWWFDVCWFWWRMLMWEDGFCRGRVSDCLEEIDGEDPIRKSFSKMSIQLYNYGEGWVLGRCLFMLLLIMFLSFVVPIFCFIFSFKCCVSQYHVVGSYRTLTQRQQFLSALYSD